jgi:hypothetical protein
MTSVSPQGTRIIDQLIYRIAQPCFLNLYTTMNGKGISERWREKKLADSDDDEDKRKYIGVQW